MSYNLGRAILFGSWWMIMLNLPPVRGKIAYNVALADTSWFRAGGAADCVFRPADIDDLAQFLRNLPSDIPVLPLGVMSNTIIRDGGLRGVVIRLGREFAQITKDDSEITAGAAALDMNVAAFAAEHGLSGLEFLIGIPGTIGGALRMNAGAVGGNIRDTYGQTSMRDVVITATAVDRTGTIHHVTPDEMHMTYRHNAAPDDWIFTGCTLRGTPDDAAAITARMTDLKNRREAAQPIKSRTGGSTFANPTPDELHAAGHPDTLRAWQLIDQSGCRGLRVGDAQMSEHHCNFMINIGAATAYDLESLGEDVRARVHAKFGITLRWEIKRLGDFAVGQEIKGI
jgi:UDP-N-acetylmuramate dehydrogenase